MEINDTNVMFYVFQQIFRYFNLVTPFFGLTVWQIVVGLFVAELGIGALSDTFIGLFNTSAPSSEERFERDYRINRMYDRREKLSRRMNFKL